MRHAAIACCAVLVGLLATPAFAGSLVLADDAAPIGLTASLEGVPTLKAVAPPTPYTLEWQQRLAALQLAIGAQLPASADSSNLDPIETGSISAAR
jgi:hypothetical protein